MQNDAHWRRGRGCTPGEDASETGQRHHCHERLPARRFRARPETLHPGGCGQFTCQPSAKVNLFIVNNLAALPFQLFSPQVQSVANCQREPQPADEREGAHVAISSACESILAGAERRISKGSSYPADSTILAGIENESCPYVSEGQRHNSIFTPAS
jgi:hypothetical protein